MADDEVVTWAELASASQVECENCAAWIVYDPRTSWWMDATGLPGCAPTPEGDVGEHSPRWTEESERKMREYEAAQVDPLEQYKNWPTE